MDTSGIKNNTLADFLLPTQTERARQHMGSLGKDDFLKLLVAQLQNQDPTSPQENTDFIAQMAQFSALEATNNMAAAVTQSQTFGLVGKGVVGLVYDLDGNPSQVIGVVDSAGMENKNPYVMIGEKKIMAENIIQVFDASIIQGNTSGILAGANLVGKYIAADAVIDGETVRISGKVDKMTVEDEKLFLLVKGHKILLNSLVAVAETEEDLNAGAAGEPPADTSPT